MGIIRVVVLISLLPLSFFGSDDTTLVKADAANDFKCTIRATGGDYDKLSTWETAIQADLTAASSKVFAVDDIGTYDATQDDGQAVTFNGTGTGTLKHISTENKAFIVNCSGTIDTGTVNIPGTGHSFSTSDTGDQIGLAIAECYNDWPGGLDDLLVIDGWTTGVSNYVKVTVAAGHRHDGTAGSGFRIEPTAAGHGIQTLEDYTLIEWVEITDWSTDTTGSYDGINLQADNALIQYVIIHDDGHGAQTNSDCNGITVELNDITTTVQNSIVYHIARSGVTIHNVTGAILNVYNTTVFSCTEADNMPGSYGCVGRYGGSGTINARNVIAMDAQNGGGDFFGGPWGVSSHNLSSDGSAPGSDSLINQVTADQFVSIAPGAEDFHLKAGADAIDVGTDLSGSFTDDIDGDARLAAWDMGADEILYCTPDNQIRNQGEGTYIGDGTYNNDGTGQSKSQSIEVNVTATYEIKLENDGNMNDSFTVTGVAGGGGWTVEYYDALAGGSDITAQVTGGGWTTGALVSGASTDIRVEVTPDGTLGSGDTKDVLVTSTSIGDGSKQDAVKASAIVFEPGAWYNTGWQYRKLITIDHNQVSDDLFDFPVLINFTTDGDLAAHAQDNGNDILFTSANGTTKLSHEIEGFNGDTGELIAWVKIPSLSSTVDTNIYMYYGNPTAPNQEDVVNVWDANYIAVWHLSEDPTGTIYDSTSNDNDGTTYGSMASDDLIDAQIGNGLDLDGSDDYIQWPLNQGLNITGDEITLSGWARTPAGGVDNDEALINKIGSNYPYMLGMQDSADPNQDLHNARVYNGSKQVRIEPVAVPRGEWVYLAMRYDGSDVYAYVNGTQVGTDSLTGNIVSGTAVYSGRRSDNRRYEGDMDELRVSDIARPVEWLETEYNNQSSPSTFSSVSLEEILSTYQPDNQIRNQGEGTYIGDDTYNNDGTGQSKYQFIEINVTATYEVKVENDGNVPDTFTITGTAGGSGWTVAYYDALTGGNDITAQVTGAGWSTGALASGASVEIRVEVTPDGTVASGTIKDVLVTSTSAADSSQDAVKATTTAVVPGAWYSNPGWLYRKKITIDHTKVEADLTDFPVLISFTSDADLAAHAQDDGDDILFTSIDGTTKLSHEIEDFQGATGNLTAWVKIPFLSSTVDTEIYMYYGNATAANQEDVANVWDSNFRAVWHLNEIVNDEGSGATHYDSTSNDIDGTQDGNDDAAAKISYGQIFDGTDDYIDLGTPPSLELTGEFNVSAWVKFDTLSGNQHIVGYLGYDPYLGGTPSIYGYSLYYEETNNRLASLIRAGDYDRMYTTQPAITDGNWHYVGMNWKLNDSNITKLFVDGIEVGTVYYGPVIDRDPTYYTNAVLEIGRQAGNQPENLREYIQGLIDEVRISDTNRDGGWIKTSYNNQSSPSAFYSVSSEEVIAPTVTSTTPTKGTTADTSLLVTINGANFADAVGLAAEINYNGTNVIAGTGVTWISSAQITATFNLSGVTDNLGAAWDVKVTNAGTQSGTGNDLFTIYFPDPSVTSITPATGINNGAVNITDLAGDNFTAGATSVKLQKAGEADINGTGVVVASPTQVTCTFDITNAAVGAWDVVLTVVGAENTTATLPGGFTATAPAQQPGGGGGGGGGSLRQEVKVDILGKVTMVEITSAGKLINSCIVNDTDNKLRLEFDRGTKVSDANSRIITRIETKVYDEPPPTLDGMAMISPAYDIIGYIGNELVYSIVFSKSVKLSLSINPEILPENTSSIFIGYYDPESGWIELELLDDDTTEPGTVSAWINHASIFAILAKLSPSEPKPAEPEPVEPEPVVPEPTELEPVAPEPAEPEPVEIELVTPELLMPAPAEFEIGHAFFGTAQVQAGEPITIAAIIQNTGESKSNYILDLKINGITEQTRDVVLAAGESNQITFILVKDEPGTYAVTLGDFTVVLDVLEPVFSRSWFSINWWLVPVVAFAIGLIIIFITRKYWYHPEMR